MDIEEILPQADLLSIHVPLLPSTYNFLDKVRVRPLTHMTLIT